MAQYKLKTPVVADVYEGEYPLSYSGNEWLMIYKASGKWNGIIRKDSRVDEYVADAKNNKRRYGLYHFLLPNGITEQANLFLTTIDSLGGRGDLPLIADVECNPLDYGISKMDWAYQVKVFLDLIEKHEGYKPMIYTSRIFWNYLCDDNGRPPEWTDEYPLWCAWYPYPAYVDSNSYPATLPAGWLKYGLWQYAEDGRSQEYPFNDYNVPSDWFKTELETKWFRNLDNGGSMSNRWTANTKATATPYANVRQSPTTSAAKIGTILPNTNVEGNGDLVSADGYTWMNTVIPTAGWVATSSLENIVDHGVITTPPPSSGIVFEPFDVWYTDVDGIRKSQRFVPA